MDTQAVRSELERILDSPAFRGSKRCQDFLRYIVVNSLEGKPEFLKERAIGIEVFGRPADYETGEDSIVRVNANEVRKRLAQYYMKAGPGHGIQIELPSGSYSPVFHCPEGAPRTTRRRLWPVAAVLAVALLAGFLWNYVHKPSAFDQFWSPVLKSSAPVLLCVAHPVVYHSDGERDPDHYVGVGDALALAQLSAFFSRTGKNYQLRIGNDTSFADLRNSPAILIGAFSNQWTMQVTRELRYVFDNHDAVSMVKDQQDPARQWIFSRTTPPTDVVIISRIFDSKTGQLVIAAAGLSHLGTQVAGEFLTNPVYMESTLRAAPSGWQTKNMQLVLKAEVIGKTPGPPQILATHYW